MVARACGRPAAWPCGSRTAWPWDVYKGLRVSVEQWEPARLHLNHDAVAAAEHVIDVQSRPGLLLGHWFESAAESAADLGRLLVPGQQDAVGTVQSHKLPLLLNYLPAYYLP